MILLSSFRFLSQIGGSLDQMGSTALRQSIESSVKSRGLDVLAKSLDTTPETLQLIVDGLTQPPGFDIRQGKCLSMMCPHFPLLKGQYKLCVWRFMQASLKKIADWPGPLNSVTFPFWASAVPTIIFLDFVHSFSWQLLIMFKFLHHHCSAELFIDLWSYIIAVISSLTQIAKEKYISKN